MTKLLLKIDKRTRWDPPQGFRAGELPAPPQIIKDFSNAGSTLSVYRIYDHNGAERTAIALSTGRDLQDCYFMVFDEEIVDQLGLVRDGTIGNLPDAEAAAWHQDILLPSLEDLCRLMHALWIGPREIHHIPKGDVLDRVIEHAKKGYLEPKKINNPKFRQLLNEALGTVA